MKILYVGDDWMGSNARSLANGFRQAGHDVIVVDSTPASLPLRLSPAWVYSKVEHRRAPWIVEKIHEAIDRVAASYRPDMIFGFKAVYLDQRRLLEAPAGLHVHYSPDDVSNPYNTTPEYLKLENQWDLIVTTKSHNVPELLDRGAQAVKFVRSAYDPAWHHPFARREGRQYLLGFVGACRPDRLDEMISLARRFGNKMLIQGPGWRRVPALHFTHAKVAGPVYGEKYSAAIASVCANLVMLNSDNRDGHTCRTFEVPAAGGLFVGERTDEHAGLLEEQTECLLFSEQDELLDIIELCENNPGLANKIAHAGHRRIVEGRNRYVDRAREIVDALV